MVEHASWNRIKTDTEVNSSPERRARYEDARRDSGLGQLIYDLRIAAGLTQQELAERMGTTQTAISRLESGGGGAQRLDTLLRLAAALGRGLRITFPSLEGADTGLTLREPAA